jgi:enamine deaminase RidA (YjgF/YER057c/UK114 family)
VPKQLISPANHRGGAPGVPTQAVRSGNMVFVGGQMSLDENGKITGTDITTQARNVFDALNRVLEEAGATMQDVVKHDVYFSCEGGDAEVKQFIDELDAVRIPYFPNPGPTNSELRVGLEVEGALIQVDAWAVIGTEKERIMPPGHWGWDKDVPWSHGWKVGDLVFTGAQRSLDANGQVIGVGDIEIQTAETFRNLETVVQQVGGDRTNLMRQNTWFRFLGEGREVTEYWEKMTNVRRQYMSVPSAAGAGIRINGFPKSDELIQVEGIFDLGTEKKRLQPENHWDWSINNSQFTQGWQVGDIAWIGGQISADSNAKAVGATLEDQTRNVFNFIKNVMKEGDLNESDVAKLYIYYLAGEGQQQIEEAAATIARVQAEFYPAPGPAVTSIRATGFAFEDLLIEIEAIALTRK